MRLSYLAFFLNAAHLPVTEKYNYRYVATRQSLKDRIDLATPIELVLNPIINSGAVDSDFVSELVNDGVL